MSKSLRALLFVVTLLVLALALNPSADKHREKIKETIAQRSQVDKVFGLGSLMAFSLRYYSFGVLSYTKVGDKTASLGLMGMVFVLE